jgi:hypothetical protein
MRLENQPIQNRHAELVSASMVPVALWLAAKQTAPLHANSEPDLCLTMDPETSSG